MTSPNNLLTGILLTSLAGAVFAAGDALGKQLTTMIPILQVIWGRYLFQTLILSGYLAATTGTRFLRSRRPVLQIVRGMLSLTTIVLMYHALARVPLADATAVIFVTPIIVTIMSVVFLKEKIGVQRICAIASGFGGMLLILSPGFGDTDPALGFALAAAFSNAAYLMMTRYLAGSEDTASTQFNTTAVGTVVLSFAILPSWETPELPVFMLLVIAGAIGAVGHFALVSAFSFAPASLLSPFLYMQVLSAGFLSILIFHDPLRPATILGTAILASSGLFIWYRERR